MSINQASPALNKFPTPQKTHPKLPGDAAEQTAVAAEVVESDVQLKKSAKSTTYIQNDLEKILLSLEPPQPLTDTNKNILQLLLDHGLPLKSEYFKEIHQAASQLQLPESEITKESLTPIIVGMRKGLHKDLFALSSLNHFFQGGTKLTESTQHLMQALTQTLAQLKISGDLNNQVGLGSVLVGLKSILNHFYKDLERLNRFSLDGKFDLGSLGKYKTDAYYIKQFISGLFDSDVFLKNIPSLEESKALTSQFKLVENKLESFIKTMSVQFLFSQTDLNQVSPLKTIIDTVMIPNIMGSNNSIIELNIHYDKKSSKQTEKIESFTISFETDQLGSVVITVKTKGNELSFLIQTEEETAVKKLKATQEKLIDSMKKWDFKVSSFVVERKLINLNPIRFDYIKDYLNINLEA